MAAMTLPTLSQIRRPVVLLCITGSLLGATAACELTTPTSVPHPSGSADIAPRADPSASPQARGDNHSRQPASEILQPDFQIGQWPRMSAMAFGCMLEREHKAPQPGYGCGAPKKPIGDPCKDTGPYYAGPEFPGVLAKALHPSVRGVTLEWEHGDLREIGISLRGNHTHESLLRHFGLSAYAKRYQNIQSVESDLCGKERTCLSIVGFDHMGAGDVECPGN